MSRAGRDGGRARRAPGRGRRGVLLPSDDFTAESAARYPKVAGVTSGPRAAVGFPWGDPLVEEAAALAAVVGPEWQPLSLVECRPVELGDGLRQWELVGEDDLVIRYGSAPGHEQAGEPTAAMKAARLRALSAGDRPTGRVDLTAAPPPPPNRSPPP